MECEDGEISQSASGYCCSGCEAQIDSIKGVPFLGNYESGDLLGLIEIAAVKEAGKTIDPETVDRVETLCLGFHESGESEQWLAEQSDPFAQEYWFPYRYSEWRDFNSVSQDIDWEGASVLDVGAGVGFDAIRYLRFGSEVTALEYNPVSIERGIESVPEANWVGGFSHLLPFRDSQFDVICVNAALHHMRDVRQAFREMFRTLKPGGTLLTSGDPFRPSASGEEYELRVFDSHPAVLAGVNEGIPNIDVFLDPVAEFGESAEGFVVTHALQSPPASTDGEDLGKGYRRWELHEFPALAKSSGSLALRLTKKGEVKITPTLQKEHVVRAGAYYAAISDLEEAMKLICPVLPEELLNREVVPSSQSWFDLLNGWKAPITGEFWRRGFGRGRWFLEKADGLGGIQFRLGWFGDDVADFEFLLNGKKIHGLAMKRQSRWRFGNLLATLQSKLGHYSLVSRVLNKVAQHVPHDKPFRSVSIPFENRFRGRCVFEIKNLNKDQPGFSVGSRKLL